MYKFVMSLGLMAATVFAQSVYIVSPAPEAQLQAGSNTTVQIEYPITLTGSEDVAIVIGISHCYHSTHCWSVDSALGTVLYSGPFDPQEYAHNRPPYQNFSLEIPDTVPTGNALLTVAHFSLVGASALPYLQFLNQSVTIA